MTTFRAILRKSSRALLAIALFAFVSLAFGTVAVPAATAAEKAKSIKTEAKFISYDAETKTIEVKVLKPGKRPTNKKLSLKKGKPAKFKVKPEGSVLVRTSVTSNGQRSSIEEIPDDKTLNIYWIPFEDDPDLRYAKKIDMVWTDEELEARDKQALEEARAKGQVSD